ncbi:hypothetical protein KJ359_002509 [Pestalotiopsis sp. 9143b]|nr:hypothetical protein KJ359_002509 [Pestalotiopsis sp. 9143b]
MSLPTQQPQSFGTRSRANSRCPPTKLFGHTLDGAVGLDQDTAIATSTSAGTYLEVAKEITTHVFTQFTQFILAVWTLAKGDAARRESISQMSTTEVPAWIMDCQPFANIAGYGKRVAMLDRLNITNVSAGVQNVGHVQSKTRGAPYSVGPDFWKATSFSLLVTRDQLW